MIEPWRSHSKPKMSSGLDLDFTCTILLLGKSGVGKSAVINSLLGEGSAPSGTADADTTKKVTLIEKKIHGMTLRLIDTSGLQASASDIRYNSAIMNDAKKFTKQHKPDIVLYFDRLDIPSRSDAADLPLLKQITNTLGQAIWFNAIVVLTHAATAPPDGANGQPISYEMYVAQRSHIVQQTIRQAAGDMRLMNPWLAEKSSALPHEPRRRARLAERSSMEAATFIVVLRVQDSHRGQRSVELASGTTKGQQGWPRRHADNKKGAPLPFLLSSLITTRKPRRLMEYDDDGFEDLENEIISGEPSPYDIPADQMEPMRAAKQVSIRRRILSCPCPLTATPRVTTTVSSSPTNSGRADRSSTRTVGITRPALRASPSSTNSCSRTSCGCRAGADFEG